MVMICVYSTLYTPPPFLPLYHHHPFIKHQPSRDMSHLQTLALYSRFVLVSLVTHCVDQTCTTLKQAFFICCVGGGGGGVFKRESSSLYQRAAQSLSRHPHPLVTERGGDPVNYRRVPRCEQWFLHSATLHSPAHLHSTTDATSTFQTGFMYVKNQRRYT